MKKLFVLIALCMATAAQATILRVSNVTNSGAPYTNIPAAIEAAQEGDTIIVDGSSIEYNDRSNTSGFENIDKRLVFIGPGYLLTQNGVKMNGDLPATISRAWHVNASGIIIMGFNFTAGIDVYGSNVVITRCKLDALVEIRNTATNVVLHQNLISNFVNPSNYNEWKGYNSQITNNIFTKEITSNTGLLRGFRESRIAYNTFTQYSSGSYVPISDISGCTVENNIFCGEGVTGDGNTIVNNYVYTNSGTNASPLANCTTDLEIQNVLKSDTDFPSDKGAFAGDDPYVISGVPAGPTIENITVPATVEQGGTLNVTIKLGIQK